MGGSTHAEYQVGFLGSNPVLGEGLLCSGCNTGIGLLEDNVESLARAIKYLQEPRGDVNG